MNITLNGKSKELTHIVTLENIVEQFCANKTPVVTKLNGEIIKAPHRGTITIKEGDQIELIGFVGGG